MTTTNISDSSIVFRFDMNEYFLEDVNLSDRFTLANMKDNGDIYQVILLSKCPSDIVGNSNICNQTNHCLLSTNGTLNTVAGVFEPISFSYNIPEIYLTHQHSTNTGGYDVSVVGNSLQVDVGATTQSLKAVLIINKDTKYLMSYCILSDAYEVSGQINIPFNGVLTSVIKYVA